MELRPARKELVPPGSGAGERERDQQSALVKETYRKLLLLKSQCQSSVVQRMWRRAGTIHPPHKVAQGGLQSVVVNALLDLCPQWDVPG